MMMFKHCGQRTDAGAMVYCKLTFEPSAEVSYKWGKSRVGFTIIKSEVFQDFSIKSYVRVIY